MSNPEPPPLPSKPARAPRRKPSVKVLFLVLGLMLLSCGTCGGTLWFLYIRPARTTSLTPSQEKAVLAYEDLTVAFELPPPSGQIESKKETKLDGAYSVDYEYDDGSIVLSYNVEYEPRITDSVIGYVVGEKAIPLGAGDGKDSATLVETNELPAWGDQHKAWYFKFDGANTGLAYVARKGHHVVSVVLGGVEVDREFFDQVVLPKFEMVETAFK